MIAAGAVSLLAPTSKTRLVANVADELRLLEQRGLWEDALVASVETVVSVVESERVGVCTRQAVLSIVDFALIDTSVTAFIALSTELLRTSIRSEVEVAGCLALAFLFRVCVGHQVVQSDLRVALPATGAGKSVAVHASSAREVAAQSGRENVDGDV